jgi:hypothetical protein
MAKKLPYNVGDFFCVPLREGGFVVGLVARQSYPRRGILLGYFFGPKRDKVSTISDAENYRMEDAILVGLFGDMGLEKKTWPVIGAHPNWNPREWPMPIFQKTDAITGKLYKVHYSENPGELGKDERCAPSEEEQVRRYPKDGLYGHGAIELVLTKRLSGSKLVA